MKETLNTITLDATLLENLYGRALVDLGGTAAPEAPPVKFLGNNGRHITILVQEPGCTFLSEEHLSFLHKILLACQVHTGDVAIVNMAHQASLAAVTAQLAPGQLLSFGVDLPELPGTMFTIGKLQQASLLIAPPLEALVPDTPEAKLLKGRLWTCLKTLFSIPL